MDIQLPLVAIGNHNIKNMKKYFHYPLLLLLPTAIFAQTFQASIQPVDSAAAITITLQSSANCSGKISNVAITLAIPVTAGSRPQINYVDNSANPFISYTIYNATNQSIGETMHYIYTILGTGDVVPTGSLQNFKANTSTAIARINFKSFPAISSQVKMVNLPNGGTDINPNAFFGLSLDGADIVNERAMFYSLPSASSIANDGNGYHGISYVQTIQAIETPPAKFVDFSAVENNGNGSLSWQMENESSNTDHYEIERSLNSIDFTIINIINSKNNGNSSNSYDASDLNLSTISSAGLFYYRIKEIDKNGKFIYSETKKIRLNGKALAILAYPNPINDFVNLTIDIEQDASGILTIYDAAGKEIQLIQLQLLKGANTKKINMTNLAAGVYLLQLTTPKENKIIRVIKLTN
jgi:hypothetical protein